MTKCAYCGAPATRSIVLEFTAPEVEGTVVAHAPICDAASCLAKGDRALRTRVRVGDLRR